jgi:type IV pilus assembly protein PilB
MTITPAVENMIRKELKSISPEELAKYGMEADLKKIVVYKGKGCDLCNDTGYKGRIAMVEVIDITDEVKNIITDKHGSEAELEKVLPHQGMVTMREDGILKALAGVTTLMEVERVTEGEEMVDEE